ncbi:MAG: hypothetical protein COB53_04525 [Elusimicrobia bacterium]|nr:MAG: hypothetical protein COB53_04525 [Elusimicrobiota bacterium]
MSFSFAFESSAVEWATAALFLLGLALLWRFLAPLPAAVRRLRIFTALILAGLLFKPVLSRLDSRSIRPRLSVVIDRGPSMQGKDDFDRARLKRAVDWILRHRAEIEKHAEVSLYGGAAGAHRLDWNELESLQADNAAFEPASVLSDLLSAGAPPERVWVLSDGAFENGETLAPALARLGSPVDALGVGPKRIPKSLSIAGIETPDFVFLHSRFETGVSVEAHRLEGKSVTLTLRHEGKILQKRVLQAKRPFEILRATFTLEAAALGSQDYRIAVLVEGDQDKRLRVSRGFRVEVIRQKYRIMYLAGRPSFEYSHLRAQLKGDPNHELVSFVILRNPEDVSPVPDNQLSLIPFPATEIFVKNLFQFDLFILENFAYYRFNLPAAYLENLKRFVAQGGALLIVGGENAFTKGGYRGSPLEETFPVTLLPDKDDFVTELFKPTLAAVDHPFLAVGDTRAESKALWDALPPLDGYARFSDVRPGASVLLSHPRAKTASGRPLPIVAVQEFGRGKVMLVGTDSTWRWKLAGGRDWKLSSFYARFWSRAVQYLTGSLELKKVKFSPLPERMPAREPAILSLRVFDEHFRAVPGVDVDLKVVWSRPDGTTTSPAHFEREPGVFQIELSELAEGRHRIRAIARYRGQLWGEDGVNFVWEGPRSDAPLNRRALQELSEPTRGEYRDLYRIDLQALLSSLPPVREEQAVRSRQHLWTWSGWLALAVFLLLGEWFLRRRRGYL